MLGNRVCRKGSERVGRVGQRDASLRTLIFSKDWNYCSLRGFDSHLDQHYLMEESLGKSLEGNQFVLRGGAWTPLCAVNVVLSNCLLD